ncbi:MAG TPA: hypothetical protein VFV52_09960 [Bacilli bacterium]|nr:hypothetical protein [Bacilli bacterium]
MSHVFSVLFVIAMLYTLIVDQKRINQATTLQKGTYYGFGLLSLFFFIMQLIGTELPMPTKFVVYYVVPLVNAIGHFY